MPTRKLLIFTAAGCFTLAAGVVGFRVLDDTNDPTETVAAVRIDDADVAAPGQTTTPATGGASQQVVALEELTGTLSGDGDDRDDFRIGGVEVDFGPESWILTAGPLEDYDGDGNREALLDELDGLTGSEVSLLVRLDDDRDDADVYVVNDLAYRDTTGGPAPWELDDASDGPRASRDELIVAAEAAVGDGAKVTDLDAEGAGPDAWEAEVRSTDGREHRVLLDAAGNVLDVRADD